MAVRTASGANTPPPEPTDRKAARLLASLIIGQADPRELGYDEAAALTLLAVDHGLGTVLLAVIRAAGVDPAGSPWAPLIDYDRWAAARYLASRVEQPRIEAALASLGIDWIWLKGYALAHSAYPRPVLRPMLDLDLLVPADRCEEAHGALRRMGYQLSGEDTPPMFAGHDRLQHHLKELQSRSGILVELHRRLHPSERLMPLSELDWFRGQTTETRRGEVVVKHFRPEAQLLHLAAHTILHHGEGDFRLQRYYDCHLLIDQNPLFDWQVLIDQAIRLGWTSAVERILTNARDYFRTPVPEQVWPTLRSARTRTPKAAWATKVALALDGRPTNAMTRIHAAAPSPLFALYQCLRVVAPSTAYMRWRYGSKPGRLPLAYVRRFYDIGRKLLAGRRSRAHGNNRLASP